MYGERTAPAIDLSRFRLTRLRVFVISAILLGTAICVAFAQFSSARDLLLPAGAPVGGDYVAFHVAAREMADGRAAALYDDRTFEARLKELGPPKERYGLTWQYPPTYFFVIAPLALLGFIPGYVLWTGAAMAAFFASLRAAGFGALALFVILAAPSTFHAVITGQNGFLTAALLIIATLFPDKRPIAAGLAAALLTVKPQLGLLIPIAYLAGGCWRAFFVAAFSALALAAASFAAFGVESWAAFFSAAAGAADNVASGAMPLFKMATPYAAARLAGLAAGAATVVQLLFFIAAAVAVAMVWRRVKDTELRAAILCASVFLAAPYAYYYELVILALPAAILAKRAIEKGWLKFEQIFLAAIFMLPLSLPGDATRSGFLLGFGIVLMAAGCIVRRIAHEIPDVFKLRGSQPD
jgi:hypothetical protein